MVDADCFHHAYKAACLGSLGDGLESQYKRTRRMQDLGKAIDRSDQAGQLATLSHLNIAGYLANLGSLVGMRYERTENMQDLERAISLLR